MWVHLSDGSINLAMATHVVPSADGAILIKYLNVEMRLEGEKARCVCKALEQADSLSDETARSQSWLTNRPNK